MAGKITVPLGFVPFQAYPFSNSREGNLGGWVGAAGLGRGQTPPQPPASGRPPMQEGGCQAGQPTRSSWVLILLIPAFTPAGGKPVWGEGPGVRCLPGGGDVSAPSPVARSPPRTPSCRLLGVQGDRCCCPCALPLKSGAAEPRHARSAHHHPPTPPLQIPASLGTSGKNKPCPAAFASRRGLAGTQTASAKRRCGGPRPWGGAAGELMNERRAGCVHGCVRMRAGARTPSCLRVWMWMWSREPALLLF